MESEASAFETSETVATFLASTPLLTESWRLCATANSAMPMGFVTDQPDGGSVGYLAFSGVQMADSLCDPTWGRMVTIDCAGQGLFGPLVGPTDDGDPAMVHAGLLQLFLSMLHSQTFINQVLALKEKCKSIVITGHSLGGSTASLATLWLLSQLRPLSSPPPVLCITFGSPLLGNKPLTRAILRERWAANFCHVVAKQDIVPRLLFAPSATLTPTMRLLLQHWQGVMRGNDPSTALLGDKDEAAVGFFGSIVSSLEKRSLISTKAVEGGGLLFWPFGNYLLCSREGAVCVDDVACSVKMMYLMLTSGFSCNECIADHVKYGEYVVRVSLQYLMKRRSVLGERSGASYETGLALALQSTELASQEPEASLAKECLMVARRSGLTPILNCAKLAISLSQMVPYRAQIEWYMALCVKSNDQMGYYDDFKLRGSSKKGGQVNMNRHKLAGFWDGVIEKLERNELPYDFQKRDKWVNSFHFYKLLVEPLDIAEYYRQGRHLEEGHYLSNGRPRRYRLSDIWWRELRNGEEGNRKRTRYASQTQDSCFWARLEEAKEWLDRLKSDGGSMKRELLENVNKFDEYAASLIEKKEVSKDVLAKNSSYTKWTEELRRMRSQMVCESNPEF